MKRQSKACMGIKKGTMKLFFANVFPFFLNVLPLKNSSLPTFFFMLKFDFTRKKSGLKEELPISRFNNFLPNIKKITKQATGLPGKINTGVFPNTPNPKGLPGLIETFQKFRTIIPTFLLAILAGLGRHYGECCQQRHSD